MRNITFDRKAFQQFTEWANRDPKIHDRIITLINAISRHPFQGIGEGLRPSADIPASEAGDFTSVFR